MTVIEEVGGVLRVRRQRLEPGERTECRRRPLPSIAHEIVNTECTHAVRMASHGLRGPSLEIEVAWRRRPERVAPRKGMLAVGGSAERRAMELGLYRQPHC